MIQREIDAVTEQFKFDNGQPPDFFCLSVHDEDGQKLVEYKIPRGMTVTIFDHWDPDIYDEEESHSTFALVTPIPQTNPVWN